MINYENLTSEIVKVESQIEVSRNNLNILVQKHNCDLLHKEVIAASIDLDQLLTKYLYLSNLVKENTSYELSA